MTYMQWWFEHGLERRIAGPGGFRFIVQPLVAIALGIRDGLIDAKLGNPPYLIGVFFHPERRRELLIEGLKHISRVLVVGIVLELVLQYIIFGTIRLIPGLIVGFVLIALPYSLARGITNRIATGIHHRRVGTSQPTGAT